MAIHDRQLRSWVGARAPVIGDNGWVEVGFSIDSAQGLSSADELNSVRMAAELGYQSAWTPGRGDATAFDRCLAWHQASGLPTGVSVVPASGQSPAFYAQQARRVWEATEGNFVLGIGSGQLAHAANQMPPYLEMLRQLLPPELPLYVAALGPRMLRVGTELADGVALNWCSAEQVAWSRAEVERAALAVSRPIPVVAAYIRTAVDPNPGLAGRVLGRAMLEYALGRVAYRKHFERMGFAEGLRSLGASGAEPSPELLSAIGAWGVPGEVRSQFQRLSRGLDLALVRVLVSEPGDAESARRVLTECRPN